MASPVKLAFIGAGNRAHTYLEWVRRNPERAVAVAVADTDPVAASSFAVAAGIPSNAVYESAEALFNSPLEADAAVICTPEGAHLQPALMAIDRGWHILLEKPVAPDMESCRTILHAAENRGVVAAVCHVLRYHPYWQRLREIVQSGEIGQVVSINHRVHVGIDRTTHTFVRGPWGDTTATSPVLLSKCCHDVDILLWILGENAQDIRSLGSLAWFRPEHAPEGSTERCIDCPHEKGCRFSAVDLYRRRHQWIRTFTYPTTEEAIEQQLLHGRYGRCVYRCGNNAPDRQALIFTTPSSALVTLTMEMFTDDDARLTNISLTGGEITADSRSIRIHRFTTSSQSDADTLITFPDELFGPFHGGADHAIVDDFIKAVNDPSHTLTAPLSTALESHRVCLAASGNNT